MKNENLKKFNLEELNNFEIIKIDGGKSIFYCLGYGVGIILRVVEGVLENAVANKISR